LRNAKNPFISYPSTICKIGCAANIVRVFPCLAQNDNPNAPSHCLFFHELVTPKGKKSRGKIQSRLETLRRPLAINQKKNAAQIKNPKPMPYVISALDDVVVSFN
jgi:hypothetical protein